ncbi:MAG: bifunctional folylpolyglutamate synthase/dihydrofolate synthase, partial [Rhizobiales bacterium]|nr:bifunctional folylpolyglutamate synthase/dihydrofolate synthase [Hyphomicrobiales bacterium]
MARSDAILRRLLQLHPNIIDLTLDRMLRILEQLGNPHLSLPPVVHIAGTNGKGSTLTYLRAGLEAAGYAVHAYTSPHLIQFHERIYLGEHGQGGLISESDLCEVLLACEAANDGAPITFFEITTAAAFLVFSRRKADVCLLEVGLGGRLDATNVVASPALTVITPVDLDHQAYLGDTIESIAAEKAGIMKRQVPCVIGPQTDAARAVMEARAQEVHAPLVIANQDFQAYEEHGRLVYQDDAGLLDLSLPNLAGRFQIENAGTAIAALRALDGFKIKEKHIEQAVSTATWPARMQLLDQGPIAAMLP